MLTMTEVSYASVRLPIGHVRLWKGLLELVINGSG